MNRSLALFSLLLCSILTTHAQDYLTGSSVVSIEPDSSLFSVALAGYGAPREGRFSITWKNAGDAPESNALTSINGKLYSATTKGELQEGTFISGRPSWRTLQEGFSATGLSSSGGKLYAVLTNGNIQEGTLNSQDVSWKNIGKTSPLSGFTAVKGKFYATTKTNQLLTGTMVENKLSWKANGAAYRVTSIANDGERVYYLNSGDTLWFSKPGQQYSAWREIGRHNSFTFDIHVRHIVVLKGRLYALSNDNKLYLAEHNTKNDLTARALAIKNGNSTAVIASADVTGFNYTFIQDVKSEIYKRRKIPASAIMINATHTHFAPVTQAWKAWGDFYHTPDSNYLNKIVKPGIIRAVEEALDKLSPSEISFARGITNIGDNRRESANLEKPYDRTLDVLKITRSGSNKSDIIFTAGCHPVFNNPEPNSTFTLSANFPGIAKKIIEQKTGSTAIFLQGFGGDINPRETNYESTGKELAGDVLSTLTTSMKKITGSISWSLDTILIPIQPWSLKKVQEFKAENQAAVEDEKKITPPYSAEGQFALTQLLEREKNVRWANIMLDHYKKGIVPTTMPLYVQIITIGSWKLVGLSREVTTEYGDAIRSLWPDKLVSVAGYCNDVPSYLPRDWHIHARTYEGYDSFFWYGQPAVPRANIRDIVLNGMQKISRK